MIKKALSTFIKSGAVAELRILNAPNGNGYTANYTGFFNDMELMEKAALKYSGKAPAVYFTLQQCKPDILARANNQMKKAAKTSISTKDTEIECYNWLPIDLDAKRMAGISATDKEHDAAIEKSRAVFKMLTSKGWPLPVVGDSGNGAHVCFNINLKNTDENKKIVQDCLLALSQIFTDDFVEVDKSVFNPARIWKLYGTMTMKGDATETRPHRMAKIILLPDEIKPVSIEQLKELASLAVEEKKKSITTAAKNQNKDGIDVVAWCNKHFIEIGNISDWKDAVKYQLTPCPFNPDHSEALIIKHPSGAVAFKCSHNGCAGKDWQDLREMYEPAAERLQRPEPKQYTKPQKQAKTYRKVEPRINVEKDIQEMQQEIEDQLSGRKVTIPMPWSRLSNISGAFRPGSLTILAGPSKKGKSFFAQNIIKYIHELGYSWAYLPLEDTRRAWVWRQLAILEGDYRLIDTDHTGAAFRQEVYNRRIDEVKEYLQRVSENPRMGHKDEYGNTIVPEVPHKVIIDWIREQAKTNRFLIVDPVSQIDSEGRETWKEESWFMRQVLGVIADTAVTLLLLTHTVKRSGLAGSTALTAEDVQGSAMFVRLAQTTLILDGLPEHKEGFVYKPGGEKEVVLYDRIVLVAAARNGSGTGSRLAFSMNKNRPEFEELGILIPGSKAKK